MTEIYLPSGSLRARTARRLTPLLARRMQAVNLDRPIVSFTFDDCPKSAIVTALPMLEAEGWHGTVYLACGLLDHTNHLGLHMSADDARAVHQAGHEIADHTFSHWDADAVSESDFLADIDRNIAAFEAIGLPPATTFAYPYGQATPGLKRAMSTRFKGARGIKTITHDASVDLNQIGSYPLFNGEEFERLMTALKQLAQKPGWLTIFTHDVCDTPSLWGCTPAQMQAVITAVKALNFQVMTVTDAISVLEERA